MALILGIDSTERQAHVALVDGEEVLAYCTSADNSGAETLLQLVADVLKEGARTLEQVSSISVAQGPGSFTGIRSGIATAQGLAAGLGRAVSAVPVFIARLVPFLEEARFLVPVLKAGKDDEFIALFEVGELNGQVLLTERESSQSVAKTSRDELVESFRGKWGSDLRLCDVSCQGAAGERPALLVVRAGQIAWESMVDEKQVIQPIYIKPVNAKTIAERQK